MPQVTSIVEKPRQPRKPAADKAAAAGRMARGANPKRPFETDATGYAVPTALEIEEAQSHVLMCQNRKSKILEEEWTALNWRLYLEEGPPATTRCEGCHVVRFGRPRTVPCAVCGSQEIWFDEVRRYGE